MLRQYDAGEGWSMDSFGQEKETAALMPSEIAQNLKVADEMPHLSMMSR